MTLKPYRPRAIRLRQSNKKRAPLQTLFRPSDSDRSGPGDVQACNSDRQKETPRREEGREGGPVFLHFSVVDLVFITIISVTTICDQLLNL